MSELTQNLKLARKAVEYLQGLQVKSTNQPRQRIAYFLQDHGLRKKAATLRGFMLDAARYNWRATGRPEKRAHRALVVRVMGSPFSRDEKKRLLRTLMAEWGPNHFDDDEVYDDDRDPKGDDEQRIRSVRHAVRYRAGNCQEKSAICATWLLENGAAPQNIFWISCNPGYDHVMVLIGCVEADLHVSYSQMPDKAVVVDGWTEDYYQANSPNDIHHGVHAPSVFQRVVRGRVHDHGPNGRVKEEVHLHSPPEAYPDFRLDQAGEFEEKVFVFNNKHVSLDFVIMGDSKAVRDVLQQVRSVEPKRVVHFSDVLDSAD
jgi:hypothetical protein